ncbi:erythromycin esterase family protein [Streptomyces sp. NPDC050658]|uniref:erythromycin esterase family protein n=1 Tax=unclassified Streptomyces TaxID=2593676 RepID=UPI00341B2256
MKQPMKPSEAAVAAWLTQHAHPVDVLDPEAPTDDLSPLDELVRNAEIVALGVSSRATRELSVAQHRLVRRLVEEHGFRSLLLEGDDPARLGLDAYVLTGAGDPAALLSGARSFWRTEEILGTLRWLRARNARHPDDPVRLAVPPSGAAVPATGLAEIERGLARDAIRWREQAKAPGGTVYWGGTAHTAVGDPRTVSDPGRQTHRNAGGQLREHFGPAYVSVGLSFHHGGQHPDPAPEFAESALGRAGLPAYLLDLRAPRPADVDAWFRTPTRTRLVGPGHDPRDDAAHHLSGGSLSDFFDAFVHVREVTGARVLTDR